MTALEVNSFGFFFIGGLIPEGTPSNGPPRVVCF